MKHRIWISCLFILMLNLVLPSATVWARIPSPEAQFDAEIKAQESQNLSLSGHIGGMVNCATQRGNYVYVGQGPRLVILDVSNPEAPSKVGQTAVLPYVPDNVVFSEDGTYAYVAGGGGMSVVDVSDPANPIQVGTYGWAGKGLVRAQVRGSYLYVLTSYLYNDDQNDIRLLLMILDLSDPTSPSERGFYETFVDSTSNSDLAVTDTHAYIPVFNDNLHIVDVSNPDAPAKVGDHEISTEHLLMGDQYLYALTEGSLRKVLHVFDFSNPTNLAETGAYTGTFGTAPLYRNTFDWAKAGNHVSIIMDGTLTLFDVSDPQAPALIYDDAPPLPGEGLGDNFIRAVQLQGNHVYALYGDVMSLYGRFPSEKHGLSIFDISDPANPVETGALLMPEYYGPVAVKGNYAYVVTQGEGSQVLRVLNVSNPSQPTDIGFAAELEGGTDIAVSGDRLYLVDVIVGLSIWDISTPTSPVEVGEYTLPGNVRYLAIQGNYLYGSSSYPDRLYVIDISDPAQASEINAMDLLNARGLSVSGDYAYVTNTSELKILNISDVNNLTEVSAYEAPAYDVAVTGNDAYVAASYRGLMRVDVTDPENPVESESHDRLRHAEYVTVGDAFIYVNDVLSGLFIWLNAPYKAYLPLTMR